MIGAISSRFVFVNVAAASEIAPVVCHLGQYFNGLHRQVSGHCIRVAVTAEPPDISAPTLVHDLRMIYDPRRPVEIVAIMLGRAGNLGALRRIAAATSGQATAITRYSQLGQAIYQTMTRALCQPSCPN
jgi:hypothetical protein